MPKRLWSPATWQSPTTPTPRNVRRYRGYRHGYTWRNPVTTPSSGIATPGRAAIRRRDWNGEPDPARRRLAFETEGPVVAGEAGALAQVERVILGPEVAAAMTAFSFINILLHARTRHYNPFPPKIGWMRNPLYDWYEDWLKQHEDQKDAHSLKHFGEYPPIAPCQTHHPSLSSPVVSF